MKRKTIAQLQFIIKDAGEAAKAMQSIGNQWAEAKYLDQVNEAATELYRRRRTGAKKEKTTC